MPIFDQGYQHWKGALSGRGWRWLAITRQGLRGQLKASIVLRILLLVAWLPALALVVVVSLWGLLEQGSQSVLSLVQPMIPPNISADPHAYRQAVWTIVYSTFFKVEIIFIMLLVMIVGPNLISRDLRFNALPLYFSRPLTRLDYFLGKLGVIGALVAAVAVVPAIAAYALGVCFSLDLGVIRDTWRLPLASGAYGMIMVVSAGTLMLAVSSLSRRSLYVGVAWVGLWIVSAMVTGALSSIHYMAVYQSIAQEEYAQARVEKPPPEPDKPPPKPSRERTLQRASRQDRVQQAMAEAAPTNWRPLCSYTANLQRLGEALLNTDAAFVKVAEAVGPPRAALKALRDSGTSDGAGQESAASNRRFADLLVPQYPWIWSAGVLAGLLGLSLWILSTRVKSLDRLR